jgi:hypothetical protein
MEILNLCYLRKFVSLLHNLKASDTHYSKVRAERIRGPEHKGRAPILVEGFSLEPHRKLNPTGKTARRDNGLIQITGNPYFRYK